MNNCKYILFVLFSLLIVNCQLFPQSIIKSIIDKKTGESIQALCTSYIQGECRSINLVHISSEKEDEILMEINPSLSNELDYRFDATPLDLAANKLRGDQMSKSRYRHFSTFRKVCELGSDYYRDNAGCIFKMLFSSMIFAGGTVSGGLNVGLEAAHFAGVLQSAVGGSADMIQVPLYYPALTLDLIKLLTIFPVKKIVNYFQMKRLRKKILPLIDELKKEIENPPKESEINIDRVYNTELDRKINVRHKHFKIILNVFKYVHESLEKSELDSRYIDDFFPAPVLIKSGLYDFYYSMAETSLKCAEGNRWTDCSRSHLKKSSSRQLARVASIFKINNDYVSDNLKNPVVMPQPSDRQFYQQSIFYNGFNEEIAAADLQGGDLVNFLNHKYNAGGYHNDVAFNYHGNRWRIFKKNPWSGLVENINQNFNSYFLKYFSLAKKYIDWEELERIKQGLTYKEISETLSYLDDFQSHTLRKTYQGQVSIDILAHEVLKHYFYNIARKIVVEKEGLSENSAKRLLKSCSSKRSNLENDFSYCVHSNFTRIMKVLKRSQIYFSHCRKGFYNKEAIDSRFIECVNLNFLQLNKYRSMNLISCSSPNTYVSRNYVHCINQNFEEIESLLLK